MSRNSFTRCYRQFLRITIINNLYRMVRQGELPEEQEKVPWGATSAHRLYPVCTLYNRHVNSPFSIFHFQFLIWQKETRLKAGFLVICLLILNQHRSDFIDITGAHGEHQIIRACLLTEIICNLVNTAPGTSLAISEE